jgi:ATP-dependent RNA helicase RhlE
VSLEQLKLSKSLTAAMLDAGYYAPKEIQRKTVSRILGGQNIMAIAPEGSGKTTAYVMATLMRLKGPVDGAPRALILTSTKEKTLALVHLFNWFGKNSGIRAVCLTGGLIGEQYMEAIEDGHVDILICTPDKLNNLYGKALLNLRSLMMVIVDDADIIAKSSQLAMIYHLFEGLGKCQKLLMTDGLNEKLERLAEQVIPNAEFVENTLPEPKPKFLPMVVYNTSNYKTKINLLEQILRDPDLPKSVIFVNSRDAAEILFSTLKKRVGRVIGILRLEGMDSLETFKQSSEVNALILCNDDQLSFNLLGIQYLFHVEIPSEKDIFLKRISKIPIEEKSEAVSITLATQPEMETIKKIEQSIGIKMTQKKLPSELSSEDSSSKESWNWKIV